MTLPNKCRIVKCNFFTVCNQTRIYESKFAYYQRYKNILTKSCQKKNEETNLRKVVH